MAQIELVPYTPAHRVILRNMAELYSHDFSELTGMALKETGTFLTEAQFEQYFIDIFRSFLIRARDQWAGFALIDNKSQLSGEQGTRDVLQFFVLRTHRRSGIGTHAAKALFKQFPAKWGVRQIAENAAARTFWRQVIAEYTKGNFSEAPWQDKHGSGGVQRFCIPPER